MFLTDIPRALVRCWYIVVVGLLATGAMIFGATKVTQKEYSVISEVLLLPPPSSVPAGDNPYLSLGGLNAMGDILARAMQDGEATNALKAAGLTSEVTFARDQNSAAPIMMLSTVSSSPQTAVDDSVIFLNQIPITLKSVQAHASVPQNAYVSSTIIVKPQDVIASSKSQLRSMMVAGVAGLAFTLLLTGLADRLLHRRLTGRRAAGPSGPARQRVAPRRRPLPSVAAPTSRESQHEDQIPTANATSSRENEKTHERARYPLARSPH
jgi:hypothetical protein